MNHLQHLLALRDHVVIGMHDLHVNAQALPGRFRGNCLLVLEHVVAWKRNCNTQLIHRLFAVVPEKTHTRHDLPRKARRRFSGIRITPNCGFAGYSDVLLGKLSRPALQVFRGQSSPLGP